jgi:hypothetical protein
MHSCLAVDFIINTKQAITHWQRYYWLLLVVFTHRLLGDIYNTLVLGAEVDEVELGRSCYLRTV